MKRFSRESTTMLTWYGVYFVIDRSEEFIYCNTAYEFPDRRWQHTRRQILPSSHFLLDPVVVPTRKTDGRPDVADGLTMTRLAARATKKWGFGNFEWLGKRSRRLVSAEIREPPTEKRSTSSSARSVSSDVESLRPAQISISHG